MAIKPRIPVKEQPVEERIHNFDSVPYGYTEEEAMAEAQRCIQCPNPTCEAGCPVNIKIKDMIRLIKEGKFAESYLLTKQDNAFPACTGRVCPQEDQCEGVCILVKTGQPINIGKLEAFVADWGREHKVEEKAAPASKKQKVAVVGSGPAGLACAAELKKFGYEVTMFETLHKPGGVLVYGIPNFRLPKDIVQHEIDYLEEIGVDLKTNITVGQNISFDELRENYDAIFLGTGAGAPQFMGIEGEKLNGVYSANEFLIRANLMKSYLFPEWDTPISVGKKVGVIGAGNVAMDAARVALRLGADEVYIIYRRTKEFSPARNEEIEHAIEEGIIFKELVNPVRFVGNDQGWVTGAELLKMELTEQDSSGRPRPVPIEGSEFIMELDTVIEALGTVPNRLFLSRAPGLKTDRKGVIQADDKRMTSIEGVFGGGDATSGAATVIKALGEGKRAAESIRDYLESK
jgi:glutamate synthase (NADPH/NADH) small chain